MAEPTLMMRAFNVWLGLAAVALLGSLLPSIFRAGLFGGLVLGFIFCVGIGTGSAAFIAKFGDVFGRQVDPHAVFVRSLEYALLGGAGLGLLPGIGALVGVVTDHSDE